MEHKKASTVATMKDVAEMAGVSTATVSRALMNPGKVSTVTWQKVNQAVLAMGYSPYALSRGSKRSDSCTILVMVPDITDDSFFSDIMPGIKHVADQHGYQLLLGGCGQQAQLKQTFLNLIITKRIDGMLLVGSDLQFDSSFDSNKEKPCSLPPMVMVNEYVTKLELPAVHVDNLTAAFKAVDYLHQLGHKRIACVAGVGCMSCSRDRLLGYIQALGRNGIPVEDRYVIYEDFTYEAGARAFATLAALPCPPTAIFCHHDTIAMGAVSQAKKLGLRIPQDVSIMGFDDIRAAQYCDPPLTTMAQPLFQIGQQAMLLLLKQLQGQPVQNSSLLLETELIIRESTSAPKY